MPTLLAPGTIWLLTTRSLGGGVHSRPVTVFGGLGADEVAILTSPDARKVAEVAAHPQVSLAGPTSGGWWAGEGVAHVDETPARSAQLLAEVGVDPVPGVVITVTIRSARQWTVHSPAPWDNTVQEWEFPPGLARS